LSGLYIILSRVTSFCQGCTSLCQGLHHFLRVVHHFYITLSGLYITMSRVTSPLHHFLRVVHHFFRVKETFYIRTPGILLWPWDFCLMVRSFASWLGVLHHWLGVLHQNHQGWLPSLSCTSLLHHFYITFTSLFRVEWCTTLKEMMYTWDLHHHPEKMMYIPEEKHQIPKKNDVKIVQK